MSVISFEIKERIGVLSETSRGWTKELRRIDWNGRGEKYDIREWSPDQRKMSRGVTLSAGEMLALREMLEMLRLELELETEEGEDSAGTSAAEMAEPAFCPGTAEESCLIPGGEEEREEVCCGTGCDPRESCDQKGQLAG